MDTNNIILLIAALICCGAAVYSAYKTAKAQTSGNTTDTTAILFKYVVNISGAIQRTLQELDEVSKDKYESDEAYRRKLVDMAVAATYKEIGDVANLVSQGAVTELVSKLLEVIIDKVEEVQKKDRQISELSQDVITLSTRK